HTPYRPANEHRLPPGSETTELSSAAVITRVACFRTGRLNPCWIAREKYRIDDPFRSVAARHSWRLPLAAATIRLSRMAEPSMAELKEARVPDIGDYDGVPVIEVLVAVGDTVKADQGLITLESD